MYRDEELVVAEADGRRPVDAPDPVPAEQLERWGISLREAIKSVGGIEGSLKSPATGVEHPVSLARWADRDLDQTFVRLAFRSYDPNLRGLRRNAPVA